MRRMQPLTDQQRDLLACLLRTPFLRARDLARELSLSQSRIYQILHGLLACGLLEQVVRTRGVRSRLPSSLYTVSPAGQYLVGRALPGTELPPGRWEISERFLRALLPRLDRLVFGHSVVHRLLVQAPRCFARQGRPAVVRWSWIRDYERAVAGDHAAGFHSPVQAFADWLVVLRVRQPGEREEQCYPLFVLLDALCLHSQLIGQRLRGLLQLRRVLARRRVLACECFPAVLILLPDWQRARCWQQAAAELARAHFPPLRGGLTVCPTPGVRESADDPWGLSWRSLHDLAGPVHLRELLVSVPPQAMPAGWLVIAHHQRRAGLVNEGSGASRRGAGMAPGAFTWDLVDRAEHADPASGSRRTFGLPGLTLLPSQYHLLELLLAYPLLSQENLAVLLAVRLDSVGRLLASMQACLAGEVLPGDSEVRYSLSVQGLRLLVLRHRLLPGRTVWGHSSALDGLQEAVSALRQRASLVIALYAFVTRLIQQAARSPGHRLLWWEAGDACLSSGQPGRPCGLGEYQARGRRVRFWLDWQEAWSHEASLRQALAGYGAQLRAPQWRDAPRPLLLSVCPDSARERQVQRFVRGLAPRLRVFATTRELLQEHGPLAPIWLMAGSAQAAAPGGESEREVSRRCWYASGPAEAGRMAREREV